MFRFPASLLTDLITLKTTTYTGLGETKSSGTVYPARINTQTRWSSGSDGALIQDATTIVTHAPLTVGDTVTLPSGADIEIKSVTEVRYCRRIVGYESTGW